MIFSFFHEFLWFLVKNHRGYSLQNLPRAIFFWKISRRRRKVRRPFKAPISLRNLVRILTQNIRTQNTCYWISLCISSYYHSLQGWFCTYLMIKFIPQILRIVYNSQYWQYVCLFDANVLFFGYVQMFGSNSYTFSTHTIGI